MKAWYVVNTDYDDEGYDIDAMDFWATEGLAQTLADIRNLDGRKRVDERNARKATIIAAQEKARDVLIANDINPSIVFNGYNKAYEEPYRDKYEVREITIATE